MNKENNTKNNLTRAISKVTLILIRKYNIEKELAEDIIQDSITRILKRRDIFENLLSDSNEARFIQYLLRSAINRYIDNSRHLKIRQLGEHILIQTMDFSLNPEVQAESMEDQISFEEKHMHLYDAVNQLHEPYRS